MQVFFIYEQSGLSPPKSVKYRDFAHAEDSEQFLIYDRYMKKPDREETLVRLFMVVFDTDLGK